MGWCRPWCLELYQAGYQNSHLFAWDYRNDTHKSTNEQLSPLFDNYINSVLNETGASKVDIVAHSFGSLPTRWFIKFGGGSTKVRNWISIAGPNHGLDRIRGIGLTINNLFTSDQGGADMQSSSYVIRKLNEGTETPEPTKYTTISSTGDDRSFFDMLGSSSSNSSDKVVSIDLFGN
ncbi:esterase/lipase family protein [Candidatus Regiella insecticola]|uniref:esterase/lipase family protein n=2 Tax=Candidatus Regiella insecticola TaxID=138073 RepID=UPI0006830F23